MRRKIFLRFFLLTLSAVLLVFASGLLAMHRNNEKIIEDRLVLESELLLYLLQTEEDVAQLESYVNKDDFRITVLWEDGRMLYESSILGDVLEENHAGREEIQAALAGTPKAVKRYSESFGRSMTYYAVASRFESGEIFLLRLAIHSAEITSYLGVMLPFLFLVLFVDLAFSGLIANKLSKQISNKVKALATGLRSLNEGHYAPIEAAPSEAEFYAVFREINELAETTHKQLRTLAEEQKKLKTVLDNISQGIVAVDRDSRIVFANPAACALFGREHRVGEPVAVLIDAPLLYDKISQCVPGDTDFEYTLGEKELSVAIRYIPSAEKGTVASILLLTDITREKSIAHEKSDFFANASHELKTPITVLLGLTELILAKSTPEESGYAQLERIHHESSRLAGLITDMLELSGLERSGRAESIKTEVNLRAVCDEVLAELAPRLAKKNLTCALSGNGTVTADAGQMYELVENICSNAVNYNKEGGRIAVNLTEKEHAVLLEISDTGIGIAKEHLPRLCERFYRVDKSRSKKTGGTGLGLAIVKHICMLNGASLNIESELGIGSKITVIFNKK